MKYDEMSKKYQLVDEKKREQKIPFEGRKVKVKITNDAQQVVSRFSREYP